MINQLYISDVHYDWSKTNLQLCNNRNIDRIIADKNSIDCWTSVEDLGFNAIHRAVQSANKVDISKLNFHAWSPSSFDTYGRLLNELWKSQHKVNQSLSEFLIPFSPVIKSSAKSLWAFGCSITYGYGIDPHERFSKLLADKLKLEEYCLAKPGTSVFWSADKILRSDLCSGDLVLWGLTNVPRFELARNWEFHSMTSGVYDKLPVNERLWNVEYFSSPTQTLQTLCYIEQVQNFCAKAGAKLILLNVLDISWMSVLCTQYSNYLDLINQKTITNDCAVYLDYGTDNLHPGSRQHAQWADDIFEFAYNQNWISQK